MRILIAPIEVAGIASGLKAGFDELGVDATLALSQPHVFDYSAAPPANRLLRSWRSLGRAAIRANGAGKWSRVPLWLVWRASGVVVLLWALVRFDAFIFLFGNTLTNSLAEAWLLKRLRKRVVMIYCGADARPPYLDGQVCHDPALRRPEVLERLAATIKRRVELHEGSGFLCVNSPFSAQFHARPFVNWFAMGVPRSLKGGSGAAPAQAGAAESGAPVRIVHSPSNPAVKGTPIIEAMVETLRRAGHGVELVLLHGVSNDRVVEEITRADLVIDQLWSDTPMAGFAVEAAHRGKPSVVGGYPAAPHFRAALGDPAPPSLFVEPDDVAGAIERVVVDSGYRAELGRSAEAFVHGPWSPAAVAGRYLQLLRGEASPGWMIAPGTFAYVQGAGMAEVELREIVRALIAERGIDSLQLDHVPALREAFRRFADAETAP